jgi:hypothetical protein
VTVRNCEVRANASGILVQNSTGVLVFNNLIDGNDATGIVVGGGTGSADVRLVNNTVVANGGGGIRIGTTGSAPATRTLVQNDIVQDNQGDNLEINQPSLETAAVRYNLVFPPTYSPPSTEHARDVNADARFVGDEDRRLTEETPAVDAGDPETDPELAALLASRTVLGNGAADIRTVDLGYHFAR